MCPDEIFYSFFGNDENVLKSVANSPPRMSGFSTALSASIKHNDGDPSKVPDSQIKGALEIALEVWPYEAEEIANTVYGGDAP